MASLASSKLELGVVEAMTRRASASGRSLDAEIAILKASRSAMTLAEKIRTANDLRAMTPAGPSDHDSTLEIRWDRDTNGGRFVDDGWSDDDRP